MIQITVVQIDNYGPWTVTPNPRRESDLQALQSRLYCDMNLQFGAHRGLAFYTRFDNIIAITNGIDLETHKRIQNSVKNRYPFTVSMAVASAETAYGAQKLATKTIQEYGSAQDDVRKEVLDVANEFVSNGYVQLAHVDINDITGKLTDLETAYDTYLSVQKTKLKLMEELKKYDSLGFFIGGDNFMCPCNGMSEKDFLCMFEDIKESCGIELKAGIGIGKTAEDASDLADIGLEVIREGKTDFQVYTLKQDVEERKDVTYNYMCPI
ncbi:GTP cyclohydrolase IIa [Methanococcus maripaludis C5]|uniref:GTP cyclohydrolase III n=1 Tax=Methanococcus maripaludis (strain C5 / ATCC BAA-1333) TaxID=402880 RepID=GCH3_METM5|nr:GTP cyclohydrolase III [Methanococcus maripaludis]A4FZ97.1 RecName: Full=GTP cyclohydrolase III [Methanococcus maripaludis C5]ABO35531.1 GTP cyclohydrolase IIa [Methanococcus maripaludis C5]